MSEILSENLAMLSENLAMLSEKFYNATVEGLPGRLLWFLYVKKFFKAIFI